MLEPIGNKVVAEGATLSFAVAATDTEAPPQMLMFSLDGGAPNGASITAGGAFTWTPTEAQGPSTNLIQIVVTDNGVPALSATQAVRIVINEVNAAPALNPIAECTTNELALITFVAAATDSDLPTNALAFSLRSRAPNGATITPAGLFTWTPTEAQGPSNVSLQVIVTDNGSPALSATQTVQITVLEINSAPTLDPIVDKSVTAGSPLAFTATASDADAPTNTLSFSLGSGAPTNASITTAGIFSWTPTPAQAPSTNVISIIVTDNGTPSLSATQNLTVVVAAQPIAITLLSMTNLWKYHALGQDLGTTWRDTNYNDAAWSNGLALLYNETVALPEPKNTYLSLTNSGGTRIVTYYFRTHFFLAADPAGVVLIASNVLDDGAVFYLNGVEAGRTNMPTGTTVYTNQALAAVGDATSYTVLTLASDTLRQGNNTLSVEVHQYGTASTDIVFGMSLTALLPGQIPITITNQPVDVTVTAGAPAQFTVGVSGSAPQYQWFKGGTLIPGANSATYTLAAAQVSDAAIYSVVVTNYVGVVFSSNALLTVNPPPNTPPLLATILDQLVEEGTLLTFTAIASDAETPPQALTFSLDAGAPTNATITPGGDFAWTPAEVQGPSINLISVIVTDNGVPSLNATQSFLTIVREVNVAPDLHPISDRTISIGSTLNFTVTANDRDVPTNILAFSLGGGAPTNAQLSAAGVFTWTPSAIPGTNALSVMVTDNGSPNLSAEQNFKVIVVGAPRIIRIEQLDEHSIKLEWESYPGKIYQVQWNDSLTNDAWQNLGSAIPAAGTVSSYTDNANGNRHRFYRVQLID